MLSCTKLLIQKNTLLLTKQDLLIPLLSTTYLAIEVPTYLWVCIFMYINERNAILLLVGAILTTSFITAQLVQGETGKGRDVFKVIMTIFAADKSKGDVVAIVT